MYHQYFCSSAWVISAYGLGGLILALWIVNAYLNVQLNAWTARFYDLMQNATKMEPGVVTFDDAQPLFVEWAVMSGINVCSKPIINWLTRHWAFYWREALTADLLFRWRSKVGGESARRIEGASQRVQDDCYQLSRFLCDLGQGILAAFLELVTFCPVLWSLSSGIEGLPNGLLMWCALGGFVLGYAVSILVGWRLVSLEYNNQAAEAAFRKELVYAEDEVQGHGELSVCHGLFRALRRVYYTLFAHLLYFETWSALFLKAMSLVPLVCSRRTCTIGACKCSPRRPLHFPTGGARAARVQSEHHARHVHAGCGRVQQRDRGHVPAPQPVGRFQHHALGCPPPARVRERAAAT